MSGATIHEAVCDALEGGGLGLTRSLVPFSADVVPEHLVGKTFQLQCDRAENDGDIGGSAMVRREWLLRIHYRLTQDPSGGMQSALTAAEAALAVIHAAIPGPSRTTTGDVVWSYPGDGHHAVAEIPFTTDSYEDV